MHSPYFRAMHRKTHGSDNKVATLLYKLTSVSRSSSESTLLPIAYLHETNLYKFTHLTHYN